MKTIPDLGELFVGILDFTNKYFSLEENAIGAAPLEIFINKAESLNIGDMLDVKIISVEGYDLFGEIIKG